ncbi:hypothetical protein LCG56_27335 (plasmid) [Pseudomonas cannabina pv. alisalensis]|uniref:Uncharacterized protein n=1 Tax=Pseudomonas syringae pv. maculicola str. ES4326 TaxID=629265 RepID=A0A8T8CA64_PSEYM|nr:MULTISPECIES: hypothetical protein [Pseudomonas syringae group]QHF00501.1 hypothetical protein PMA4326_028715 [Pseudomonas syringae pv. maculicola str. ES4326]UBZ00479.1 hypothetical protein LCG56_27335 [Pseudomonas cannabina pv. alisalensis]
MKSIIGMFWGMVGGVFVACGLIVFTQLIGAGADLLGFTIWTFRYYMICLSVCIAFLVLSKPARKHWRFMTIFLVAVSMVIGVGFNTFLGTSSTNNQLDQMANSLLEMSLIAAKAVMYLAPGALTAFYAFVAFSGVSEGIHSETIK